ncbi:hypothetical protein BT63DRAFT_442398 [Microthyrium microscopicum]|uniref:NADH-ubiquinone oxidoreductase B12 subunit n=1 Tax=Microthyrium microscopicum TaxID=703497 RepID=A0A6A6U3S7_9PEZI|nr:hypothetical protein BT63DRAFT_442398 [Microthyrium microscopicum]
MSEIKSSRDIWREVGTLFAENSNKPTHLQMEQLMERATGQKIASATGFHLADWKAAGEAAMYKPGGDRPKGLNPIPKLVFLKSWFLGEGGMSPALKGDPWARHEAWRYTGPFNKRELRWRGTFPGLGLATAAFAVYLAYDTFLAPEAEHH